MVLDVHSYPRAALALLLEMPVCSATSVSVIPRRVRTALSRAGTRLSRCGQRPVLSAGRT